MEKWTKLSGYAKYSWIVLGYTILVILWGAFVRATGSGAGCGSHWPTCNGEVIPRPESIETVIEFSHRLTSAILGPMVIALVYFGWRKYGWSHRVTYSAILTLIFVIIEGGIGAALVVLELVADNPSSARAIWMGAHLINTLILLAFNTANSYWASGGPPFRLKNNPSLASALGIGMILLMIVSAFGAITALGDTLFPAESFAEGAAAKFDPEAHFSVRARIWHPVIGVGAVIYLITIFWTNEEFWANPTRIFWTKVNIWILVIQIFGGVVNVLLAAPVWKQLMHLLLADMVWIALIIITIESLSTAEIPQGTQDAETYAMATGD
ncbi:MAG: COX15/CtaA family protein [Chloroflexota bacterium]